MFHLHVGGIGTGWLSEYDGSDYSNEVMGQWFLLYHPDTRLHLLFA